MDIKATVEGIGARKWSRLDAGGSDFISYRTTGASVPVKGDRVELVRSGGMESMEVNVLSSRELETQLNSRFKTHLLTVARP